MQTATPDDKRSTGTRSPNEIPEKYAGWIRQADDLGAADAGDAEWVVPGRIARGEFHHLVSEPKDGKTTVAAAIAVALAAGLPFAGWPAPRLPTPVLFIEEEGRAGDLHQQLKRLAGGHGVDLGALPLFVAHRAGVRLDEPTWISQVREAAVDFRAGLVVLDHLSAMHRLDENPAAEAAQLVDGIRAIQQPSIKRLGLPTDAVTTAQTAVLLLHHAGKADRSGAYRGRGSSALPAAADLIWNLRSKKDKSGRLARIEIGFVGRRPVDPISLVLDESGDLLRLLPSSDTAEMSSNSNGRGKRNPLSAVIAYLAGAGPTQRKDLPDAVGLRRADVFQAVRDGLRDGSLLDVDRDGKPSIDLARDRKASSATGAEAVRTTNEEKSP